MDRHQLASDPVGERPHVNLEATVVHAIPLRFVGKRAIYIVRNFPLNWEYHPEFPQVRSQVVRRIKPLYS